MAELRIQSSHSLEVRYRMTGSSKNQTHNGALSLLQAQLPSWPGTPLAGHKTGPFLCFKII